MGKVVQFKRPRRETIKGASRKMLTDAVQHVGSPVCVVIYAQNADGVFAVRSVHTDDMKLFDALARAEAAIAHDKSHFLEPTPAGHEYRE